MANSVGHRDDSHPEGERDSEDPDAELRNRGAQERAPAADEHQPERSDRFRSESLYHLCLHKRSLCVPHYARGSEKAQAEKRLGGMNTEFFCSLGSEI